MKIGESTFVLQLGGGKHRRRSFWKILLDFILVLLTGGLWLLWLFIRYLRDH